MYREQSKRNLTSILTNRPKAIKTLEDAYGVKYQMTPSKTCNKSPTKNGAPTVSFKDRGDMDCTDSLSTYRPNYNKYLITASDRYGQSLPTSRRRGVTFTSNAGSDTLLEDRHAEVLSKQEQYFSKSEKTSTIRSVTPKPIKSARSNYGSDDVSSLMSNNLQGNFKKNDTSSVVVNDDAKKKHNEYHRHHQHKQHDNNVKCRLNEEKDDTEEFIALIRREIEKSVVKSITERMNNTFADINKKVDRQAAEIKKIGSIVQKLHSSLSSKISHYGEENSRHFRYLCMKSEYDKMFYQHHNQIAAKSAPVTPPGSSKGSSMASTTASSNIKNNCALPSARTLIPDQLHNLDTGRKPLDENMRDMVSQLKKFCLQYETTAILEEDFNKSGTSDSSSLQLNNPYQNCGNLYPDDETNFSSDGMTPRSVDNDPTLLERKHSKSNIKEDTLSPYNKNTFGGGDI